MGAHVGGCGRLYLAEKDLEARGLAAFAESQADLVQEATQELSDKEGLALQSKYEAWVEAIWAAGTLADDDDGYCGIMPVINDEYTGTRPVGVSESGGSFEVSLGGLVDRDASRGESTCVRVPYEEEGNSSGGGSGGGGWDGKIISKTVHGYNPNGTTVWEIVYVAGGGSAALGEVSVVCDYEPDTSWPDCPDMA